MEQFEEDMLTDFYGAVVTSSLTDFPIEKAYRIKDVVHVDYEDGYALEYKAHSEIAAERILDDVKKINDKGVDNEQEVFRLEA